MVMRGHGYVSSFREAKRPKKYKSLLRERERESRSIIERKRGFGGK